MDTWTLTKDKLPEKDGDYLVTLPCGDKTYMYILGFNDGKFYDEFGDLPNNDSVIAWMPLPTPLERGEIE